MIAYICFPMTEIHTLATLPSALFRQVSIGFRELVASETVSLLSGRVRLARGLFLHGRPAAITRLIVAVIVDAVNGMGRRGTRPHVCEEVQKAFVPSFANGDTTSTIPMPVLQFGVTAPLAHVNPCAVLGRHSASYCMASSTQASLGSKQWITTALPAGVVHRAPSTRKSRFAAQWAERPLFGCDSLHRHILAQIGLLVESDRW